MSAAGAIGENEEVQFVGDEALKEGVRVRYNPVGGNDAATTTGVIKKILTEPEVIGSTEKTIHASKDEPRYLIENDNTHKETAYSRGNLIEILD